MQGFTARVKYRKSGLTRLIGHLDTVRALLRAVRRAGIEGVYSQGFTPRLKLSFGTPLPLGWTSECEFFDIKLARPRDEQGISQPDSITHSLQSHLPEGLFVEEVQVLQGNHPPPATAFWAAEYRVENAPAGAALAPHDCPINAPGVGSGVWGSAIQTLNPSPETPNPRVVRARWHERDDGTRVLSIVLRRDPSGKGGSKQTICDILGMSREAFEKCRVHKKRVYAKGEQV